MLTEMQAALPENAIYKDMHAECTQKADEVAQHKSLGRLKDVIKQMAELDDDEALDFTLQEAFTKAWRALPSKEESAVAPMHDELTSLASAVHNVLQSTLALPLKDSYAPQLESFGELLAVVQELWEACS